MQAIVELPLEAPLKLRVIQIAWVQIEVIGVHRHARISELDDQFDAITFAAGIEGEQRVLIKTELGQHAFDSGMRIAGHRKIVFDNQIPGCILASFPPDRTPRP